MEGRVPRVHYRLIEVQACACDLLTVGLETFETVPRAMIQSSGDNKEAQQSNHCLPMSFTQAWLQGFNQEKQSMCTREELEREEGVTRIFRTLPSHVGVHTNPWYCKQVE
ncbi:unnamed protein product [Miscanthus lutarioriparius]|uniref:Uncharacterized protein n=1 Tax=Miscanthus lutarioriparius TaxID=422564 RepID=A0A811QVR2_9POAL|nr:unnamed protein product [Miscanthus lutarioriparius]